MFTLGRELRRVAEVSQLDVAVDVCQNIVRLDVSVYHVLGVKRVQPKQDLLENVLARVLAVVGPQVRYDRRDRILHQLDEDPESVSKFILIKNLEHNLVTAELVHQSHFIAHHVLLLVRLRLNEL